MATYSSKQGIAFTTHIYISIKKSYNTKTRTFIKVQVTNPNKPGLKVYRII